MTCKDCILYETCVEDEGLKYGELPEDKICDFFEWDFKLQKGGTNNAE
jgi:hypothetical protein